MRYDKLVRDRIPEIVAEKGGNAITHIAEREEYEKKLKEKLQEEMKEFLEASTAEELADILEVVYALGDSIGMPKEKLEELRADKAEKRGSFSKGIILEES